MIAFQNPEILVLIFFILVAAPKIKNFIGVKKEIALLNILTAFILILAAAGPQITVGESSNPKPQIKVIEDSSESSALFDKPEINSEDVNIIRSTVNSDRQDFRSQVKNSVDANETVLFSSDFNANIQGLPEYFRENNISANVLRTDATEEHAVTISGPSRTVIGAENSFAAEASSTVNDTEITVGFENETIYSGSAPHEFELSFEEEGYKRIWIETSEQDEYSENNAYYKVVEVREKPVVASIGPEGGLEEQLDEFYEIENFDGVPENLERYDNVLLKKSVSNSGLEDYLVEGGGLVYTGSDYDAGYLPVRQSESDVQTDAPVVVLVIDISAGTRESGAAEAGKQIAYELVDSLPANTRVGVAAYNRYAYDVIDPTLLASDRENVKNSIASLQPEGPTFHHRGLRAGNSMLRDADYEQGNIVMISDGELSTLGKRNNVERETFLEADRSRGRVITVGVGDQYPAQIDEEEKDFLTEVAERTEGGFYVDGHSTEQLGFSFDAGGGTGEMQPLTVTDSSHFITEDYNLQASIADMDATTARDTASQLVSTSSGSPFLTTWRYGLGKVVAFSGDTQDLQGLMTQEPGLVGRSFSWATRNEERNLWVEGERQGDEFYAVSREPRDGYTRRSENRYETDLKPNSTGFYRVENLTYSKNYRSEIEEVGYNEENIADITVNGRVYEEDQIESFFDSIDAQPREELNTRDLTPHTVFMFLLVYLGFLALRKRNSLA